MNRRAGQGVTRQGEAWRGEARLGKARQKQDDIL